MNKIVIPANAGIQVSNNFLKRRLTAWIPAFAGMTFLVVGSAHASYNLDRVLFELENREKTLDAVQFDFKQEIHFLQMDNNSTVTGEALFGKAGKLRITKESPTKQLTVSDGKKVWIFNPAAKQVWEGSSKKWLESPALPKGMIPLDNYVEDLRANFNLRLEEEVSDASELVHIVAEPKNKNLEYRMKMSFAKATWLPVETVYSSESAEVVTTLSKHQVNPLIEDGTFRFSPPKGTNVIPLN